MKRDGADGKAVWRTEGFVHRAVPEFPGPVCPWMVLSSQSSLERGLSAQSLGSRCRLCLHRVEGFSLKLNALFLSNSGLRIYFLILDRVLT